ncbi:MULTISPECIES: hypothetical protein [unclassified Microbacterium]|uniref:hypothetical protein n=1 Tax=unclassified Microbacterium TaxID=2609290 RepID=UPI00300FC89B
MTAFATVEDLEALLKTTYEGADRVQVKALLEAASGHLRFVIGQDVYPVTTSTYTAYPTFGREDLPQWPVVAVSSVKRDGMDVPFTYRPGFIMVGSDEPVDVTFTWGVASPPEELKRLTLVLAAQALQMFETTGALSAGGLSSLSIDDFRAAFADGGSETGISLSPHAEKSIRRAFGRGDVTVVEAYT